MVLCARLANLPPNESSSRVAMFARLRRRCRLHETIGAELGGDPTSRLVKPGRKRAPSADRLRQTGQTEKDGLEDVLGIVAVRDESTGGRRSVTNIATRQPDSFGGKFARRSTRNCSVSPKDCVRPSCCVTSLV